MVCLLSAQKFWVQITQSPYRKTHSSFKCAPWAQSQACVSGGGGEGTAPRDAVEEGGSRESTWRCSQGITIAFAPCQLTPDAGGARGRQGRGSAQVWQPRTPRAAGRTEQVWSL